MGIRLSGKNFTIYSQGNTARELIIMCHGGMSEGDGTVKPPNSASVRFYTQHWQTGSGGQVANALAGFSSGSYKAEPKSISGPGSPIWNYTLTWDGPGGMRPHEKSLIEKYASGAGSPQFDLAMPDSGLDITLKELFKKIEKAGIQYSVIHYCPCRVVSDASGENVMDPNLKRQIESGAVKFL